MVTQIIFFDKGRCRRTGTAIVKPMGRTETSHAGRSEPERLPDGLRERVLSAAIDLITREGSEALTTRAVAAAAGVQAPTLYRLFGDKSSLLDAVAEQGFLTYLKKKQVLRVDPDPLANLRAGWDLHVNFGLSHPAIFSIMSGTLRSGEPSPAAAAGVAHLRRQISALAVVGRLRVSEDHATDLMRASGRGTVLTLLELPEDRRDLGLSTLARESVIAAIVTDLPAVGAAGVAGAAVTLKSLLPEAAGLTTAERAVMAEWLDRLTRSANTS